MAAIVGLIRIDGAPIDMVLFSRMLDTLSHRSPHGNGVWCLDNAALGHGRHYTTAEAMSEVQPLANEDHSVVVVADARLDNRSELANALNGQWGQYLDGTDASLILAAYMHWGSDCSKHLIGDFAFAVWDRRRGSLLCARDTMGVRSLFFFCNHQVFAFATEVKALLNLPDVSGAIDEEHFANFLIGDFCDRQRTFYSNIKTVLPRQNLIMKNGDCTFESYWDWDVENELRLGTDEEYAEAFREVFTTAVESRLRSAARVGSFLSGGLDSSSISCIASDTLVAQGRPNLLTFSAIFPTLPEKSLKRIDERHHVAAVLERGRFEPHYIEADKLNPLDEIDRVVAYLDGPHAGYNMYLHNAVYKCAQANGVDAIMDGVDGDTVVSHGYERLAELAKRFQIWQLLREARSVAKRSNNAGLTTKRVITELALRPLNIAPSVPAPLTRGLATDVRYLNREFVERWDIQNRIRELVLEHDPFTSARATHAKALAAPEYSIVMDLADKTAAINSVEARYPFFDRRVMEFCLSLPPEQKLHGGWSRYVLRKAMAGVLPESLRWRSDKANLSPNFDRGMRMRSKEMLNQAVEGKSALIAAEFFNLDALMTSTEPGEKTDWTLVFSSIAAIRWLSPRNLRVLPKNGK